MGYTEILQSCHELWVLRWLAHVWVKSRRRGPVEKKEKRTLYESKMNRNEEKRGNIQQIREGGGKGGKGGEKGEMGRKRMFQI